jgi:hypothetical protein
MGLKIAVRGRRRVHLPHPTVQGARMAPRQPRALAAHYGLLGNLR